MKKIAGTRFIIPYFSQEDLDFLDITRKSKTYDLVLNGYEIAREHRIHQMDLQEEF